MAKVKKMALGGMGNIFKNVGNSVKQATVQNKMLNAAQSAADASKFKPLPPGSIGMPGGPGGKTVYNTGPMPKPVMGKPVIAPRPVAKPVIAPRLAPPTPQPVVGKKDAFYSSPEYKDFKNDPKNMIATMDMYDSPYFGSVGSGSVGRAQDAAYRKYKGIAEPTPDGGPVGTSPAPIGVGQPSSRYNSLMGGGAAPSQPVMGNNIANTGATAFKRSPATFQAGMKKGGAVKAPAKKMASGGKVSSASRRGDGIAQRGKTRA